MRCAVLRWVLMGLVLALPGCALWPGHKTGGVPDTACAEPAWFGRLTLPGHLVGFGQGDTYEAARMQARADMAAALRARISRECVISRAAGEGGFSESASCRTLSHVEGDLEGTQVFRQARCEGRVYVAETLDLRPLPERLSEAPGPVRLLDAGPDQPWRAETVATPVRVRDDELADYFVWKWGGQCPRLQVAPAGKTGTAQILDGDRVEAVFVPGDGLDWALFHVGEGGVVTHLGVRKGSETTWPITGEARLAQLRRPEDEFIVAVPLTPAVAKALPAFSMGGRSARADLVRLDQLLDEVPEGEVCLRRYRIGLPDFASLRVR